MKNQYFGDVSDYRKYGLLRALLQHNELTLGVCWMLTPDDGRSDGAFRRYLNQPRLFRHHDPTLYDALGSLCKGDLAYGVWHANALGLLPRTTYYEELVPDECRARGKYGEQMLAAIASTDLVFFDPDNGIEVSSCPVGRKNSSKYVLWNELSTTYSGCHSLLVYQHFPRRPRYEFIATMSSVMAKRFPGAEVHCFRTAHVGFFLVAHEHHAQRLRGSLALIERQWQGQLMRSSREGS